MIRKVRIVGFRSLRDASFEIDGGLWAVVGRNGSGKSNALRALNLFFNGVIESGVELDLSRDFNQDSARARNRQEIRVEVTLALPQEFSFRNNLTVTAENLGFERLTQGGSWKPVQFAKTWQRDPSTATVSSTAQRMSDEDESWIAVEGSELAFLETLLQRLIRFRYVPNHVHPLELIRRERDELQHRLIVRMSRKKNTMPQANPFDPFNTIANELMADVTSQISAVTGELSGARVATPSDWADIALSLDLELQADGAEPRAANLHGSGHQSLLAVCLLHLVDTEFASSFGWRQATIWAIEEPESFLHHELAHGVAQLMSDFVKQPRFSAFMSTHSPSFMAYADGGSLFSKTGVSLLPSGPGLVAAATESGASPFVHPILAGSPKPLLVVEGRHDITHLKQAYARLGKVCPFEIREVEDLATASGSSGLKKLAKEHRQTIGARPADSPVVLLFDHDESPAAVSDAAQRISRIHPRSTAIRLEPSWLNPDLDPANASFAGIEALLGTDFVEFVGEKCPEALLRPTAGTPISLKNGKQSGFKKQAAESASEPIASDDYSRFEPLLDSLENLLK